MCIRDRYEEVTDWDANMPRIQRIDLTPLDPADNRELVDEILQHVEDVPAALRELIANRAEGNPYYTEELVHMLVDQRVILPGNGLWRVDLEQLNNVRVPATLTNLLQARVDGLPRTERQVLKQASIVGRIFWDAAAAAVAQMERSALVPSLNSVAARELIYRRGLSVFAGAQEFIFKHALLHDVVYESVLVRLRKQYHRRAAEWLEANAGERISEYLAVIADHYELAGLFEQAAGYLERSGDFASNTNAYATASEAYERSLKLLGAIEANPDEYRARLGYKTGIAHLDLGELETAKTWLAMAITAASEQNDGQLSAQAQIGFARALVLSGDYPQARELALQALAIAEHIGGETLFRGLMVLQLLDWTEGDLAAAEVTLLHMLAPVSYTHLDVYKRQCRYNKPTFSGDIRSCRILKAKSSGCRPPSSHWRASGRCSATRSLTPHWVRCARSWGRWKRPPGLSSANWRPFSSPTSSAPPA